MGKAGIADRKANALHGELEESRSLLNSADRGKKQTEIELTEARAAVNDMTAINSKAASDKRTCESAVHSIHAEIDDMLQQAKHSEDSAKKAMVMQQDLPMSSELSKTMPPHKTRQSEPWRRKSMS